MKKLTAKSFTVEKVAKPRASSAAQRQRVKRAPAPSPPAISTNSVGPVMTRNTPRDATKKRGAPPDANQSRAAGVTPGSYNATARTFDLVLSSFADVKRWGLIEQLNSDPSAWDLSRVGLGQVKFLDSHNQGAVGAVLGTLTDARFENGLLVGTVQLAEGDAAKAAEVDIASGHLKGVSIGYRVEQWTLISTGDLDTWRADKITLLEASLVSVPADAGAMIRAADEDDSAAPPVRASRRIDWSFDAAQKLIERAEFLECGDLARGMIAEGYEESAIIRACFEERALRSERVTPIGGPRAAIGSPYEPSQRGIMSAHNAQTLENPGNVRVALENALYARMTGKPPEGAARSYMAARLEDYENILAQARGERRDWWDRSGRRWTDEATRSHSASDFPNLLLGSGNRVLQDAYEAAQSPLILLGRERQAADFRPVNILSVSEAPTLEKVKENGEVTYGSRSENKEAFSVETFARLFSMSRQAMVNDDLGAFADFLIYFARAAAETQAAQLVALMTANSGNGVNLADATPLFSTTRGNKAASGTVISVAALGAARQALRETKGLDGKTPIGLTPRYIVVGPAKETEAEQAVTAILANQVSNTNPFAGKLEVLTEPRLTGNAWRVFADPAQQSVLSYAYLNGKRAPILETREGWTVLGVEFRAILDFGCGVTDWRGAYLNTGA